MTWTGWVALFAAQITVVAVVRSIWNQEVPPQALWEQVLQAVPLIGLLVLDGLVLAGVLGRGWPIAARASLELLVAALAVYLFDDAVVLASKLPPRLLYPMGGVSVAEGNAVLRARHRGRIYVRIVGVIVLAVVDAKLGHYV